MTRRPSIVSRRWCPWILALAASLGLAAGAEQSNSVPPAREHPAPAEAESNTASNDLPNVTMRVFGTPPVTAPVKSPPKPDENYVLHLQSARRLLEARMYGEAEAAYTNILGSAAPEKIKRTALIELGEAAEEQKDLARAQQIYAQVLALWPEDQGVPALLLRQGLIYRRMGLVNLAVSKFYAVMTSALSLQPDSFSYYQQLVLRAQIEVAETQFELGNYAEAVDSFGRLLKLDLVPAMRAAVAHQYINCLAKLDRRDEVVLQARDFLDRYPDATERPEVRFMCATALKQLGRDLEAMNEVLALLKEQHGQGTNAVDILTYWQRRAGNEIANQFYQQGDPLKALDIYVSLATLDNAPDWQLPVWYQIGLVFERLNQPAKAIEYYKKIAQREKDVPADAPPSLKSVVEMAKWRTDFLGWQVKTETARLQLGTSVQVPASSP
jgi:tetratricopeptide (TPR) repeat protein